MLWAARSVLQGRGSAADWLSRSDDDGFSEQKELGDEPDSSAVTAPTVSRWVPHGDHEI